ncbi:hypothetical protein KI387_044226 [Taxus chinensis]|uniref:Aspartic peptidase DDI1-type domain-containing protein n=1 Tax=Taxus chinensis TaxID=29808 RepID=A0AA38C7V2_TAXCH|nr:hypothetical protein KI387_044226 [Taxus chinensis]
MTEENENPSIVVPKEDIERKEKEPDSNTTETPFPERFKEDIEIKESELVQELRKLNIEIPLLQAIKDIPELNKLIKILCMKNPGRKKQYPKTIKVDGKLADLLAGKLLLPKYRDPGSPVISVSIGNKDVHNVLIDLGAAINVMTVDTLKTLPLMGIQPTNTILHMADQSVAKPEGIIEDVVVMVESWEYPVDFLILQPKGKTLGYPIILGRPWLATVAALIDCRSGDMTISNGKNSKQISLYPTAQPFTDSHEQLWVDSPETNKKNLSSLAMITLQDHVREVEEMINPPLDENLLSSVK